MSIPPLLADVVATARLKHIPRGQILLYADDVPSEVYVLKNGVIKIYDIDDQGNEKILHLVQSPAIIPFSFFSGGEKSLNWFYAALTDCDIYVVPAAELHQAVATNGELGRLLTREFSDNVHEVLVRLSGLNKTNTHDKILTILKFLVVCHATERRSGWWRVNFTTSHQLLADMAGITRESTAVVMKDLQDKKIIRNPRLTILEINRQRLIGE